MPGWNDGKNEISGFKNLSGLVIPSPNLDCFEKITVKMAQNNVFTAQIRRINSIKLPCPIH